MKNLFLFLITTAAATFLFTLWTIGSSSSAEHANSPKQEGIIPSGNSLEKSSISGNSAKFHIKNHPPRESSSATSGCLPNDAVMHTGSSSEDVYFSHSSSRQQQPHQASASENQSASLYTSASALTNEIGAPTIPALAAYAVAKSGTTVAFALESSPQSTAQAAESVVTIPAAFADPALLPNQASESSSQLESLRNDFISAIQNSGESPSSPGYSTAWIRAQQASDAAYMGWFGQDAFNTMQSTLQQQR